jgi:hypothetical protein
MSFGELSREGRRTVAVIAVVVTSPAYDAGPIGKKWR